jgi:phage shock protein PspC (stress-responsive transcriptional regulator)
MQKVVHASLHGNAFTLEEAGYEALRAYLARAEAQLDADPDRDEILGDLEQAIADKCARHLGPHKAVVTAAEMQQVLDEMGPVGTPAEVGPEAPAAPRPPPAAGTERRLYRVLEGGKLAGLCNGLGAYLGVDPNLIRAIFVILTLLTSGAWLLVYLVLVFVVPAAGTPEERAAARGLPFSAQQLVDEAKRHYATLEQELQGPWARWRAQWMSGAREARHQARKATQEAMRQAREATQEARCAWREQQAAWSTAPATVAEGAASSPPIHPTPRPTPYARQVVTALVVPVVAFWSAALLVGGLVLATKLIVKGQVLGWSPGLPLWGGLLILVLLLAVVSRPIEAVRSALHRSPSRRALPWLAAWEAVFWTGFVVVFTWLAWRFVPELREVARDLPGAWAQVRDSWHASH